MNEERRQFHRVSFDADGRFVLGEEVVLCRIVDLSLHGAFIKLNEFTEIQLGKEYRLQIPLGELDEHIDMDLTLVHQQGQYLGLRCLHIDLDSITHLRRLIELNLGDAELLDRDFNTLTHENGRKGWE